ncbi:MAG: hypothetical protein PHR68_00095 [Candidatus Gracilibacteria bacterium]|nr:hypothetical protein [Candidatus Gracilibacteria bacterium]
MNLLQKFQHIDQNHKSMIFLNWIYTTGAIISGVFTTFYVYKLFGNSIEIILYFLILSLVGFFIYSLISLLIGPIYRVSEHVYDLRSMDFIKHGDSDFFPAMILREFILIIGRLIPIILLIFILNLGNFSNNNLLIFILGTILLGQFLAFISIYIFEKKNNFE